MIPDLSFLAEPPFLPEPPMLPDLGFAADMALLAGDMRRAFGSGDTQDRERERAEREAERRDREREREQDLYNDGQEALNEARYDRAVSYFTRLAELKGPRVDAALFWKAYAQNRLGQRAEALTSIAELTKGHPNSRYLKDAKMLEVEVRRDLGQPVRPQDQTDEEVKLMALQALQNTSPEQARRARGSSSGRSSCSRRAIRRRPGKS
jgi:tetratricopeptide (TPR) repeat protein